MFNEIADGILKSFLCLLVDKNRLACLPGINREYKRLKNIRQNDLCVIIRTAKEPPAEILKEVEEKYKLRYSARYVEVIQKVDLRLLGGTEIWIGDLRECGSLAFRLEALKTAVESGINEYSP